MTVSPLRRYFTLLLESPPDVETVDAPKITAL